MGDRTTVVIKIRHEDFLKHEDFFASYEVGASHIDKESSENTVALTGDDINYAEWSEIESFLQKKKIEYDKWWGSGGDYESGDSYYRTIVKGKRKSYIGYDIYSSQINQLEMLIDLEARLLVDPKKTLAEIRNRIKNLHPFDAVSLEIPIPNSIKFIKEE